MNTPVTLNYKVHFDRRGRGSRGTLQDGEVPSPTPGRVPRVARLMALALHLDKLLQQKAIASYGEIAELGHVSRARVSQILNLLNLAPDIQEALLFLPKTMRGKDP